MQAKSVFLLQLVQETIEEKLRILCEIQLIENKKKATDSLSKN